MFSKLPFLVVCLVYIQTVYSAKREFVIVNDLHYDPTYWTTQESCNKPIAHNQLGPYGHFECDAPWQLVERAVDGIEMISGVPEFIVWLGDNAHHPTNYTTSMLNNETMLEIIGNITRAFQTRQDGSQRGWKVLPVLGNHDWYPSDQLPVGPNKIYDELAEMWKDWLDTPDAQQTFKKGGYYSLDLSGDFRVVVLNTCLYLPGNRETIDTADPANQFAWFTDILLNATTEEKKVHVFSHIPSGVSETDATYYNFRPEYASVFNKLIRDHAEVIVALHAVHIHTDSFRMFYKDKVPVATEFISPAVVPWRCRVCDPSVVSPRNPALRRVFYEDTAKKIQDIEQYYFHLPPAGDTHVPNWIQEYRFKNYAALSSMPYIEPEGVHQVLESFKPYGSDQFHDYYRRTTVNVSGDVWIACGCICKIKSLCSLEFVEYEDHAKCIEDNSVVCDGCSVGLASAITVIIALAAQHFSL